MGKQEWAALAVALMNSLQQAAMTFFSSKVAHGKRNPSLVFAVTVGAGLIVAAALGGTLMLTFRKHRKRSPLAPKQWDTAFDVVSGCFINRQKVLDKVRFGGIEPHLRSEVWPFLLGFYDLNSTQNERESEKCRKRALYEDLKQRCNLFRAKISEAMSNCDESNVSSELSCEVSDSSQNRPSSVFSTSSDSPGTCNNTEDTDDVFKKQPPEVDGRVTDVEDTVNALTTNSVVSQSRDVENAVDEKLGNINSSKLEDREDDFRKQSPETDDNFSSGQDGMKASTTKRVFSESRAEEDDKDKKLRKVDCASDSSGHLNVDSESRKAVENFANCQRIIRLDAVRMNAEWVPYSPTQASVTNELAFEVASNVGLKDDEHLEPCRQHHAARLVAILEAYALHDPETGYCQGMSDLLSPFVALLDEDYEAFWCFVQFMKTARFNFRSDEIGIQRQLNKISSIFKAGDSQFYSHLESIYAENCFFVYRMVVVLLRRELTFEQTISLWEVLWAEKGALSLNITKPRKVRRKDFLTEDLLLFVIAAAIFQRRKVIMTCMGLDEVLRECNEMSGHLDVWKLLRDARNLAYATKGRLGHE